MIEPSWLTKHERGVMTVALQAYANVQRNKARTNASAEGRARAAANEYVASDLLRQLNDR